MGTLSDPRRHDELLNYRLKRLFNIGGAPAVRLCEGRYGVSRFEWRIIAALVEDGPMSPSELTARTQVDAARISNTIGRLVSHGLLKRDPVATQGLRAIVSATGAGQRLYEQLFPELAAINRRIMAALSEDEAAVLDALLVKLAQRVQEIFDEGGGVDERADRRHGGSQRLWREAGRLR